MPKHKKDYLILMPLAVANSTPISALVRWRWRLTGRVQGVGFRPFVHRLAHAAKLAGMVWNDSSGVVIEAQGSPVQLEDFAENLVRLAPSAAQIRSIKKTAIEPEPLASGFTIQSSHLDQLAGEVSIDLAVCPNCLAELRDANNQRRHGYALVNCTLCGPRFSIVRGVPYDRARTTMAGFAMCEECASEYGDPVDRRFHAQPTCCRQCGPEMELLANTGGRQEGEPIAGAAQLLADGKIVAVKGIGGYHLAVRADQADAVARLRSLKHRPAKPFALMVATAETAQKIIELSHAGVAMLQSLSAPIVLAARRLSAAVDDRVAPNCHRLGIMLAYSPLHHLLFDALAPLGVSALVMTSGNDFDQPLVFEDSVAPQLLGGLCDAILRHNRPIERAVDDSVVIDTGHEPIYVRRARGFVPEPIALPEIATRAGDGLAVGGEQKSTVAIAHGGGVVLSQHLGNLTQASAFAAFKRAADDLQNLFRVQPKWIACDLHPAYLSTVYSHQLAAKLNVPVIGVQHHHAHAAAVLAEHNVTDPALAVICDGTGFGTDGTIWGGELLVASLTDCKRIGRLRPLRLPGGDAAAKQPWRSAMGLLYQAAGDGFADLVVARDLADQAHVEFVGQMICGNVGCVESSSTGRMFDAIAALLGVCAENRYDAQAPAMLESLAFTAGKQTVKTAGLFAVDEGSLLGIDLSPFCRHLLRSRPEQRNVAAWALLFHHVLADAWTAAVRMAAKSTGLQTVALGGGVFCNQIFSDLLTLKLTESGLRVIRPVRVPPNDGGIAYGQAAVAAMKTGCCQN